jgi:hypothetical protein
MYRTCSGALAPAGNTYETMADFWREVEENSFWRREHFDERWDTAEGLWTFYCGEDADEDEQWEQQLERVR